MFVDGIPCHFSYSGDTQKASEWISYAKKVFITAKKNRIPERVVNPAEGVVIYTKYLGSGNGIIRIEVTEDNPFLNGMAALHLSYNGAIWNVDKTTGVANVQFKGQTTTGQEKTQLTLLNNLKVKKPFLKDSFKSEFPSYSYAIDKVNNIEGGSGVYPQVLNNSPLTKIPGKYSGEMRKVVQTVLGFGGAIGVEYNFYRTHGIFVNGNNRYIIEIGSRGIYAMKLKTTHLNDEQLAAYKVEIGSTTYDLPYKLNEKSCLVFPVDSDKFTDAIQKGTIRKLAEASALGDFYSNSPYFYDCGWAFNIYGNEIQNTCWKDAPADNPRWVFGSRYKVTLVAGSDGWPKLSNIALVDSGYLHGSAISWWVPKDNTTLQHFDIFRHYFIAPPGSIGTTFYVFYDGDTEVKVGYLPKRDVTTDSRSDTIDSSMVGNVYGVNAHYDLVNGSKVTSTATEVYVKTPINAINVQYYGNANLFESSVKHGGVTYVYSDYLGSSFYADPTEGVLEVKKSYLHGDGIGTATRFVGVIPANDREAMIIYRDDGYYIPPGAYEQSRTGYDTYYSSGYTDARITRRGGTFQWAQFVPIGHTDVEMVTYSTDKLFANTTSSLGTGGTYGAAVIAGPIPGRSDTPGGAGFSDVTVIGPYVSFVEDSGISGVTRGFTASMRYVGSGGTDFTVNVDLYLDQLGNLTYSNGDLDPFLTLWYQSVPDAFTGNRMISKRDGATSLSDMILIGSKLSEYSATSSDISRIKYFFGAP